MIDLTIAELFNYDYKKIPQLYKLFNLKTRKISTNNPTDLRLYSNYSNWNKKDINTLNHRINFTLSSGWIHHIEKNNR